MKKMYANSAASIMELMVVVLIISSLAAIGYPNYIKMRMLIRREEGRAAVTAVYNQINRYMLENNKSVLKIVDLDRDEFMPYKWTTGDNDRFRTKNGYYTVRIWTNDTDQWDFSAVPIMPDGSYCTDTVTNQCRDTECYWIYLLQDGTKFGRDKDTVATSPSDLCWR